VKRYPVTYRDRTGKIKAGEGLTATVAPFLLVVVRSPELGRVRAMEAPGSPELAKNEAEGTTNTLVGLWPRDRVREGRMAERGLRVGRGNSGERFWPRRGG
jgi:hypothetical protein